MDGENVTSAEAESSQREGQERQRSTIGFPYIGLKEAAEMSDAIYQNVGSGGCEDDQLAAWFGSSPKSSGFRVRLAASRLFGLIETSGGHHSLTQLGLGIVDPEREAEAKVDAFLNVPLFRAIFEAWRGRQLPPAAALEREIVSLGVAEKQKERARQTLERSAQHAGFCEQGQDRLVRPGISKHDDPPLDSDARNQGGGGNDGDGSGPPTIDPIIQGLINRLPPAGAEWGKDERKLWLGILESSFDLVYKEKQRAITHASQPIPANSDADDYTDG